MLNIKVKASDNGLLKRISQARTVWIPEALENDLGDFIDEVIEEVEVYPPETAANSPPPPYYERGVGYYGRSGKLTKISEQLQWRWGFELNPSRTGVEGKIFNRASYSGWVQDRDTQVPWHARTGWKTVQDVTERKVASQKFMGRVKGFARDFLSKFR